MNANRLLAELDAALAAPGFLSDDSRPQVLTLERHLNYRASPLERNVELLTPLLLHDLFGRERDLPRLEPTIPKAAEAHRTSWLRVHRLPREYHSNSTAVLEHGGEVLSVAWHPTEAGTLVSGGLNGQVRVWRAVAGTRDRYDLLAELPLEGAAMAFRFEAEPRRLRIAGRGLALRRVLIAELEPVNFPAW
jgi:hypothetical protein